MEIRTKRTVLLVDDEPDLVELVSKRLEALGLEVITAVDGYEALNQASQKKPDLILLDLMLPKMDGFQVCRLLKFSQRTSRIPILIFSVRCQQKDKDLAKECGADGYLTKPFDPAYLTTLQSCLSQN